MRFSATARKIATLGAFVLFASDPQGSVPEAVRAQWPFAPTTPAAAILGDVTLRVTIDAGRVSDIAVVDAKPMSLADVVIPIVRGWSFDASPSRTFVLTLRHRESDRNPCTDGYQGQVIRARLPTSVEVVSSPAVTCDPSSRLFMIDKPLSEIRGVVRCKCPPGTAIPGATVLLTTIRAGGQRTVARALTDSSGLFRFVRPPAGDYVVHLSAVGYASQEYRLRADPAGSNDEISASLDPNPRPPSPDAVVIGGTLPTYPASARTAGLEGEVVVDVAMQDNKIARVTTESPASPLTEIAISAVQTWTILTEKPVVRVNFRYHLRRDNCADNLNTITLKLPDSVDVEGAGPCRH